jgi:hydrogenase nickel incorporation protein HypA/HybF
MKLRKPWSPFKSMHEFSIAASLVEKLSEFERANPDKKIHEIRLAIGELSHIEHEQLRFCYDSITKETPLEGSVLKIDKTEALVECPHCSYHGRPKYWDDILAGAPVVTFLCPACGKTVEETQGKECEIKSIKFSQNEPVLTDDRIPK